MPTELFISYKREPVSIRLARALKGHVEKHFPWVKVVLDETELRTGASIKAYMDRLTQGDHIIFLLSPAFLESPWCMYELALTADYADFAGRVLHVRLPGVEISTANAVAKISKAWQQRWKDLKADMDEILGGNPEHLAPELKEELRISGEIVKGTQKALLHMRATIGMNADAQGELDWEILQSFLQGWIKMPRSILNQPFSQKLVSQAIPPKLALPPPIQELIDDMIRIEGGLFEMGAESKMAGDDASPTHKVILNDFLLCKYQVTQIQWESMMGSSPAFFSGNDNCPVETINWYDCKLFVEKLNQITGLPFRLPTEAEWEFAAMGGGDYKSVNYEYIGGNDVDEISWYRGNSSHRTHPVGMKPPNALGLYDMAGNVFEWCQDWYDEDYYKKLANSISRNPICTKEGTYKVVRGGAWDHSEDYCTPHKRYVTRPKSTISNVGFRLAMDSGGFC